MEPHAPLGPGMELAVAQIVHPAPGTHAGTVTDHSHEAHVQFDATVPGIDTRPAEIGPGATDRAGMAGYRGGVPRLVADGVAEPGPRGRSAPPPSWSRWTEAPAVVSYRPHLVRTVSVALVVGSILFAINQLDVVMAGDATARTWVKTATTYLVPFCVANFGVLTGTRRREPSGP